MHACSFAFITADRVQIRLASSATGAVSRVGGVAVSPILRLGQFDQMPLQILTLGPKSKVGAPFAGPMLVRRCRRQTGRTAVNPQPVTQAMVIARALLGRGLEPRLTRRLQTDRGPQYK